MKNYKVTIRTNLCGYKDYSVTAESKSDAFRIAQKAGFRVAPCAIYAIDDYAIEQGLIKALNA